MKRVCKALLLLLLTALLVCGAAGGEHMYKACASQPPPTVQTPYDGNTFSLYSENGLWGVKNGMGRVLVPPEWYSLREMSDTVLIARRGGRASDLYGLLRIDGDLLTPLVYSAVRRVTDDIWAAELTENAQKQYHLYRGDGILFCDAAWDSCTAADGVLSLTQSGNQFSYTLRDGQWRRCAWVSSHDVGGESVRMEWDEAMLGLLPADDVLTALGDMAAGYLTYLFVTGEVPDPSLLAAVDNAALKVAYRYRECSLTSAFISRIKTLRTEGYPAYLMQIQVHYRAGEETVQTAMYLTVTRNAAGAYAYSDFLDTRTLILPAGTQDE